MKLRLAYAMDPHKTHRVLDDETMARLARVCDVVSSAPLHYAVEARLLERLA